MVHHKRYDIVEAGQFALLAGDRTIVELVRERIEVRRHVEAAITEPDAFGFQFQQALLGQIVECADDAVAARY